jgi:Peptidase family S41
MKKSKYTEGGKKRTSRQRQIRFALFFAAIFSLMSCEKLLIEANPTNTPTANFDFAWQQINSRYPFFEYKKINFDSLYKALRPRVSDTMNDVQLFRKIDTLLFALKDGHTNLFGAFNVSRNWQWYLSYPDNYDANLIERNYLKNNQLLTGALSNHLLDSNRIGYLRYASFSNDISDFSIDFVISRFQNTRGVIIDVRSNGGGSLGNVDKIVSRFIDKDHTAWKEARKKSAAKGDLTPAEAHIIKPEGTRKYLKPVVILTNRRCYSATTFFTAAMSTLPNVKIIGDWTGGGGGIPTSTQLPNGWVMRYSSSLTTLPNGFNIENGMPPTIKIDMTKADLDRGFDSILERAIKELQ